MSKKLYTHPDEAIILNIRLIRGQKVLLDSDLAKLYGVEVKVLNQAVKRNKDRFPLDFMFQLTDNEVNSFISHRIAQVLVQKANIGSHKLGLQRLVGEEPENTPMHLLNNE